MDLSSKFWKKKPMNGQFQEGESEESGRFGRLLKYALIVSHPLQKNSQVVDPYNLHAQWACHKTDRTCTIYPLDFQQLKQGFSVMQTRVAGLFHIRSKMRVITYQVTIKPRRLKVSLINNTILYSMQFNHLYCYLQAILDET